MDYDSDSESASLQSVSSNENARVLEQARNDGEKILRNGNVKTGAILSETISSADLQTKRLVQVASSPETECCECSDWLSLWNKLDDTIPPSPVQKRYADLENMLNKSKRHTFPTARQIISSVLACMVCAVEQIPNAVTPQFSCRDETYLLGIYNQNKPSTNAWNDSWLWSALAARLCRSSPATFKQYAPQVLQQLHAAGQSHRLWNAYSKCSPTSEPPEPVKFVLAAMVHSVCQETSQSAVHSVSSNNAVPNLETRKARVRKSKPAARHVPRVTDSHHVVAGSPRVTPAAASAGTFVKTPLWSAYMMYTHMQRLEVNLVLSTIVQCVCEDGNFAETERIKCNTTALLRPALQKPLSRGAASATNTDQATGQTNKSNTCAARNTIPAAPSSAATHFTVNALYTTYLPILQHVRFAYENNTMVIWADIDKEMHQKKGTALREWVQGVLPLAMVPLQMYAFLMDVQNRAAAQSRRQKCALALNCIVDAVDVCGMCASICTLGCLTKDSKSDEATASNPAAVSPAKGVYTSAEDTIIREAVRTWEQFGLAPSWAGVDRRLGRSISSAQHRWKYRLAPGAVPKGAPVLYAAQNQQSQTSPLTIYQFTAEEDALLVQHLDHLPEPVQATVWSALSVLLNRPQYALRNRWHRLQRTMIRQSTVVETELWACYAARNSANCVGESVEAVSACDENGEVREVLCAVVSTVAEVMNAVLERQCFTSPSMPKMNGFRAEKRKHFSLAEDEEIIKCARQRLTASLSSHSSLGLQSQAQHRCKVGVGEAALPAGNLRRWEDLDRCLGRSPDACRQRLCRLSLMKRYKLLMEMADTNEGEESTALYLNETGVRRTEVRAVVCALLGVVELAELYPLHAMHFK